MSPTLVVASPVTSTQGPPLTPSSISGGVGIPLTSNNPGGMTTKTPRTTRSNAGSINEGGAGEIPLSAPLNSGPSSAGTSGKGKRPASAGSGPSGPSTRLSVTTADLGGPHLQDQQSQILKGNVTLGAPGSAGGFGGGSEKKSAVTAEEGSSAWSQGPRSSAISTPNTSLPFPPDVIPRALTIREAQLVDHLVRLQLFLATAPSAWQQYGTVPTGVENQSPTNPWPAYSTNGTATHSESSSFVSSPHPALNRFLLPNGEYVSCVYWNGLYQITGTDIVRALAFRFEAFGRPVKLATVKKFEEGVFSDLRNLKPGEDSSLEKPKSDFLDTLFKFGCIRTQKKQKVFFWFSVPHDRLFLDALERDLKREKEGLPTTTEIIGEPARSFRWDPSMSLFEQFADSTTTAALEGQVSTERVQEVPDENFAELPASEEAHDMQAPPTGSEASRGPLMPPLPGMIKQERFAGPDVIPQLPLPTGVDRRNNPFTVSLFEGSPAYKQRRKKGNKERSRLSRKGGDGFTSGDDDMSASDSESSQKDMGGQDGQHLAAAVYAGPSVPQPGGSNAVYMQPPPQHHLDQRQQYHQMDYGPPIMQQDHSMYPSAPESSAGALDYNMGPSMQQPMVWHASTTTVPQYPVPYASYSIPHYRPAPNDSATPNISISRYPQQSLGQGNGIEIDQSLDSNGGGANGTARMFRCPLDTCCRLFKRLEHLKRHVRTHTQERPYNCTRCSKRFSRSDNLTQHLKTHEKADRGDRAMSTTEQSESDADFASRLEAQVEAMAGESYHGSAFGEDQSNYGSPAPSTAIRYRSVPVGVRANGMDPGRFSMPPPSMPGTYTPQTGAVRLRNASYPYAGAGPQYTAPSYGNPSMAMHNMQPDQMDYSYRAQTRSPMPAPAQIPQRSMSVQHGSGRQVSVSRFAPYPARIMEPLQQQLHAPQPQPTYQHYMPQHQQNHHQQPMQIYQDRQEFSQQMQDSENNFAPQGTTTSYGLSPHDQGIQRGDSPAINPLIIRNQPLQHQVQSQPSTAMFQPYSAGMASQISRVSQHSNEHDGSHIPLQSPATLAFEGMVATASYSNTEAAAAGWPMPEGEDQHGGS